MRLAVVTSFALLSLTSCSSDSTDPVPRARTYRMGFSALPPRPNVNAILQGFNLWTQRADLAIVHEELPWTDLVNGVSPDAILQRDKRDLINLFRSKGLDLVFMADGTDGLARDKEAPQLRALGRSITEPAIRQLFVDYVVAFVRTFRPEYVGLAAETNLVRLAAPRDVYDALVSMANLAAQAVAALPDPPTVFVSVQVEVAWGNLQNGPYLGVEDDFQDFPFTELLGLSSYPYFSWPDPHDLPNDYYSRILAGRRVPVMVVEGGWTSRSFGGITSSDAKQARYLSRQASLLDGLDAVALVQLTFTDLDLSSFPASIGAQLAPFASLGLVDAEFEPKPALVVWDSLFGR